MVKNSPLWKNYLQVPKLTPEKKETIIRDIHALIAEIDSSPISKSDEEICKPPLIPTHGSNTNFPSASSILEQKTAPNYKGRYVITTKPIKIGDVLFSEMPYASILLPEHYSSHCHHCVSISQKFSWKWISRKKFFREIHFLFD